jgi:hypothetical protein
VWSGGRDFIGKEGSATAELEADSWKEANSPAIKLNGA